MAGTRDGARVPSSFLSLVPSAMRLGSTDLIKRIMVSIGWNHHVTCIITGLWISPEDESGEIFFIYIKGKVWRMSAHGMHGPSYRHAFMFIAGNEADHNRILIYLNKSKMAFTRT